MPLAEQCSMPLPKARRRAGASATHHRPAPPLLCLARRQVTVNGKQALNMASLNFLGIAGLEDVSAWGLCVHEPQMMPSGGGGQPATWRGMFGMPCRAGLPALAAARRSALRAPHAAPACPCLVCACRGSGFPPGTVTPNPSTAPPLPPPLPSSLPTSPLDRCVRPVAAPSTSTASAPAAPAASTAPSTCTCSWRWVPPSLLEPRCSGTSGAPPTRGASRAAALQGVCRCLVGAEPADVHHHAAPHLPPVFT